MNYFDKNRIKEIFDNLRNLGLAALLLVIGLGILNLETSNSWEFTYYKVIGALLTISSICLLLLNTQHAILVLFTGNVSERKISKRLVVALMMLLYALCVIPIYSYIVVDQAQSSPLNHQQEKLTNQEAGHRNGPY